MRPLIVDFFNRTFQTNVFGYLVPVPAVMYVLAICAVGWIFVKRCEKSDLSAYHALSCALWSVVGGMLGARAFYLLEHWRHTFSNPEVILEITGGTTSWGAYLGGFLGFAVYLRRHRLPILPYADVLGSCLGLGPAIGRWSCLLNGCCFGSLSNLPWAIRYPEYSYAYASHLRNGLIEPDAPLSLSVHPVQLYLALSGLLIFFVMSRFWKISQQHPGRTFSAYWLFYAGFRFLIEFYRGDAAKYTHFYLTRPQIVSLIIVLGVGIYVLCREKRIQRILAKIFLIQNIHEKRRHLDTH
jgi:phosphatidylglycerol:prolipoprotein diacylglycerol transferase